MTMYALALFAGFISFAMFVVIVIGAGI